MPPPVLRLLGAIDCVSQATGEPVRLGRKPRALLALVAAHGARGVTRERAVSLLWGDQEEHAGAAAMRQCLHHLRRSLEGTGVVLSADRDRIALPRTASDAGEFAELAASHVIADLERAARLFRGDFAEGLTADDEEFAHWLRAERLRLRELAYDVVTRLARLGSGAQPSAAAIALARRLLVADPVHEGCYRALMRLLDGSGLRAEALRVYEECRRALREELDVDPSAETISLAANLRAAAPAAPGRDEGDGIGPALQLPRGSSTAARAARRASNPACLDRMLRAWQLFSQCTPETNRQARVELETALAIDPSSDDAMAMLGWTHFFDHIGAWTDDPDESYRRAWVQAERAFAIAGDQPSPHQLKAKLLLWAQRHDEALEHARFAVELAPAYAPAQFNLADVLVHCGLHEEGLAHVRTAMDLDPVEYGMFRTIEALALFLTGDCQGALRAAQSALTRNPNYGWSHWLLAAAHSDLGNFEAARAAARRAREIEPRLRPRFDGSFTPLRLDVDRARFAAAYDRIGDPGGDDQAHRQTRRPSPVLRTVRPVS